MKKIICLIMALLMVIALAACAADPAPADSEAEDEVQEATDEEGVGDVNEEGIESEIEVGELLVEPEEEPVEGEPSTEELTEAERFYNLVNTFSDPPEFDSEADEKSYIEGMFQSWKNGESFHFIVQDENGEFMISDVADDFDGEWKSGDVTMTIETVLEGSSYTISIYEPAKDAAKVNFYYFGATYFDSEKALMYECGELYEVDKNAVETALTDGKLIYADGTGKIVAENGKLTWTDDKNDKGEGLVFEKKA